MVRTLFFLIKLAVLIIAALWLINTPGEVHLNWHGYKVDTSASLLVATLVIAAMVLAAILRLWELLLNGPRLWRMRRTIRRLEDGQQLLTKGMAAIAMGDGVEAGRVAVRARKVLGHTPATRLLQAQAAQLVGDNRAATELLTAMTNEGNQDAAVLGYRGLIAAAMQRGDIREAEQLTGQMQKIMPKSPWLALVRFDLAVRRQQWKTARTALLETVPAHLLPEPEVHNKLSSLFLAESAEEAASGHKESALQLAEKAMRQTPHRAPVIAALAKCQLACGHLRAARRTLERGWEKAPHKDLADLYIAACQGTKTVDDYRNIEKLVRSNRDTTISRYVLASSAMRAELWGEARRSLLEIAESGKATKGIYLMLARLEEKEATSNNKGAAARWLARATEAMPDPTWLCRECGGDTGSTWQPTCALCGAFDSLEWGSAGIANTNAGTTQNHHLSFNVDNPIKAKIQAIIQKRITTVGSDHPNFSK